MVLRVLWRVDVCGRGRRLSRYTITVRGKRRTWSLDLDADPRFVEEWRADGLEIDEVINTIPAWWVDLGLPVGLWVWAEDFVRLRWLPWFR